MQQLGCRIKSFSEEEVQIATPEAFGGMDDNREQKRTDRPHGSVAVRICQVSTGRVPIPSGGGDGVENTVHHLSTALVRLGHDVTVIDVFCPQRAPVLYKVADVNAVWRDFSTLPGYVLTQLTFQMAAAKVLRRFLYEQRFDVVHLHSQLGAALNLHLTQAFGVLSVFGSHNAIWSDARQCLSRLQRWKFFLEVNAIRRADGVICDSKAVAMNLQRHVGAPGSKLVVVPIGVDEEVFEDQAASEVLGRDYCRSGGRIILNVARIAPYKDQLTLIRSMGLVRQQQPSARLVLVGPLSDKRYVEAIKREIRALGLEQIVTVLGEIPRKDLLRLYHICDVFVLCSVMESQGLSLAEAMAKGKPVVATAIGPVLEVMPQDAGIIVPPGDPERMGRAIIELLADPIGAASLGRRAREHVTRSYRWETMAARTLEAYRAFGLPA